MREGSGMRLSCSSASAPAYKGVHIISSLIPRLLYAKMKCARGPENKATYLLGRVIHALK